MSLDFSFKINPERYDFIRDDSSLDENQRKYCRCLIRVEEKGSAYSPYGVCKSKIPESVYSCSKDYDFSVMGLKELLAYASLHKIVVPDSSSREAVLKTIYYWKKGRGEYGPPQNATREEMIKDIGILNMAEMIKKKYGVEGLDNKETINYIQQFTGDIEFKIPKNLVPLEKETLQQNFDLENYMGKWFLAARIPQVFDRGTPWETAEYSVLGAGMVKVLNTAYNQDNSIRGQIEGKAEILDPEMPSALKVSFPTGMPKMNYPNYLIHNTDYKKYAIVGSSDRSNLYILTRMRPLSRSDYEKLLAYVVKLGYDLKQIVETYGGVQ